MNELINNNLVEQIKSLLEASRQKVAVEVNTTLLHTYWQLCSILIGKSVVLSVNMSSRMQYVRNTENRP